VAAVTGQFGRFDFRRSADPARQLRQIRLASIRICTDLDFGIAARRGRVYRYRDSFDVQSDNRPLRSAQHHEGYSAATQILPIANVLVGCKKHFETGPLRLDKQIAGGKRVRGRSDGKITGPECCGQTGRASRAAGHWDQSRIAMFYPLFHRRLLLWLGVWITLFFALNRVREGVRSGPPGRGSLFSGGAQGRSAIQ
jgi:hypothetical protein